MQPPKSGYGHRADADLIAHIQCAGEIENSTMSRELHDELGGLLVGAAMDLAQMDMQFPSNDSARGRLTRARQSLAGAIDLERKLIERLRPSILDTIGLFAALRWQLRTSRKTTGLVCTESYPDEEPTLNPRAAITIFRIFEEILAITLRQHEVSLADVGVTTGGDTFKMRIAHNGKMPLETDAEDVDAFAFSATEHRVHSLGGRVTVNAPHVGGGIFTAYIPLNRVLGNH
jgi:signal transduction histidine kinase